MNSLQKIQHKWSSPKCNYIAVDFSASNPIYLVNSDYLFQHENIILGRLNEIKDEVSLLDTVGIPILVESNSGVILDGHYRYNSLKGLGLKYMPCIFIDIDDPRLLFTSYKKPIINKYTVIDCAIAGATFSPGALKFELKGEQLKSVNFKLNEISSYQNDLLKNNALTLKKNKTTEVSKNIFAKLEFFNPTGSIKDRCAIWLIKHLLHQGIIDNETTLIESSSGNFAIALAAVCQNLGLKFICVIDPNITIENKRILTSFNAEIVTVNKKDINSGYLLTRIAKVKELVVQTENSYWINQYGSELVSDAYCETIGKEIIFEKNYDFIFVGVSSGGTIAGILKAIKKYKSASQVIPVDTEGSVVFLGKASKRYIPGIGSTKRPDHFDYIFPENNPVIVKEYDAIKACYELLDDKNLYVGGSSGSVYHAMKSFMECQSENLSCIGIFADSGERYCNSIFNKEWVNNKFGKVNK